MVRKHTIGDTVELLVGGMLPFYAEFQDEASHFKRPLDGESLGPEFIYSPGSSESLEYYGPNVLSAGFLFRGLKGTVDPRSAQASPEVSFTVEARAVAPAADSW